MAKPIAGPAQTERYESGPYCLQLIAFGMLLENAVRSNGELLDRVSVRDFSDRELREVVELMLNRKTGGKQSLKALVDFLHSLGCDTKVDSFTAAHGEVLDRLIVDGEFVRAVEYIRQFATIDPSICTAPSETKREFSRRIKNGAGDSV